jgi:hypothetical protein
MFGKTGREYITDILMREEEHWLDRVLKEINIPDKIDLALKSFAAKMCVFGGGEVVV